MKSFIKKRRYYLEVLIDEEVVGFATSDEQSFIYGMAYSTLFHGHNTTARLYDGDDEIPMEDIESHIQSLSPDTDIKNDFLEDIRDHSPKTNLNLYIVMADYLEDLAKRMKATPLTVYELLVIEHSHEPECMGYEATGFITSIDTMESLNEYSSVYLDDRGRVEEQLRENDIIVMGTERLEDADQRCLDQGLIKESIIMNPVDIDKEES